MADYHRALGVGEVGEEARGHAHEVPTPAVPLRQDLLLAGLPVHC
jgi:hypothetical protein